MVASVGPYRFVNRTREGGAASDNTALEALPRIERAVTKENRHVSLRQT